MGKNDDSGDDASPSQSSTVPGRGKLEQLHKKELKDLRDKSKNELKKTKDKERKREIEARYRTMEDELVAAFKEKFRLLAEAPTGDVVEKPAATTNKQVSEDLQQAGDSGHDRIAAGGSGGTPAEPPPEKAVLATIDVGAADDQDDERDASPTKTEGGGALTEEEKIARKRAKKQRQRDNKEQKKKEEDEKRAKIVEEMGTPLSVLENERMAKQLKKEGMKLFDIPSDGNCLFRAVHHQLKFIDHPAAAATTGADINGKIKTYDDLRHLTADTLEKNRDEYEAFLLAEAEETGESWESYVEKIRNGPLWGGYTELSALAKALESRILVYQGEGDRVLEFGADDADWELRISYHKFLYTSAHYNSLLPA